MFHLFSSLEEVEEAEFELLSSDNQSLPYSFNQ